MRLAFDDVAQVDATGFVDGDARKKVLQAGLAHLHLGRCARGGGHVQAAQVQALPCQQFLAHLRFGHGGGCRGAVGLEVFNGRVARQLQAGALVRLRKRHLPPKAHIGAQQFNGQLLGQVAVQPMQGHAGSVQLALGGERLQGQRALVVDLAGHTLGVALACRRAGAQRERAGLATVGGQAFGAHVQGRYL